MHRKFDFEKLKVEIKNNTEKVKNIRKLLKEKEYEKIFELYGSESYCFFVPSKYQKKEIKKLLKESRFYDIYIKYGESVYEKYLPKMQAIDIYMETNKHKFFLKSKQFLKMKKKVMAMYTAGVMFLAGGVEVLIPALGSAVIQENSKKYCDEITKYNNKIQKYASDINKLNLTNFQIVMKVMEDMWNSIDGYGTPERNILGFMRLEFLEDNGVGVCRNMADDVTAKLNAINPDFNARNLIVYMEDRNYNFCNIERKEATKNENVSMSEESNETPENENQDNQNSENVENLIDYFTSPKVFGNHMVVLFDMPGENITMVADPTNPSLGVFKNGEIYMFSTPDGKGIYGPTYGQRFNGIESAISGITTEVYSYFTSGDIETMREKYGIEAENKALDEVHSIVQNANKPKKYSDTNIYHNSFANDYEMEHVNTYVRSK